MCEAVTGGWWGQGDAGGWLGEAVYEGEVEVSCNSCGCRGYYLSFFPVPQRQFLLFSSVRSFHYEHFEPYIYALQIIYNAVEDEGLGKFFKGMLAFINSF